MASPSGRRCCTTPLFHAGFSAAGESIRKLHTIRALRNAVNTDQAHDADPSVPQAEGPPPELEQMIEHMRASYILDLQALSEELRKRLQATQHATLEVLPGELAQQQDMLSPQTEKVSAGVPSEEVLNRLA